MSLAKSIAGYIISSLFIISLYLSISSYTLGGLLQKENIVGFVENQVTGDIASQTCDKQCSGQADVQKCQEYCNFLDTESYREQCRNSCTNSSYQESSKEQCINFCTSQISSNESKQYIYKNIDDIYNKKIIDGLSLNSILPIFKNTLLLIILSLIFGFSIFLISDKPVSKIGNDIIIVSISMLAIAVIPVFIITPDVPILKAVIDYVLEGLNRQLIIGVILLMIGIILIVIGKKKGK